MEPDPRAVALLTAFADDVDIADLLALTIGWGENRLQLDGDPGDGGRAFGLLQVRTDWHGHDGAWWSGYDGAVRSLAEMRGRWQTARAAVPGAAPAVWAGLSFAERVQVVRDFWHAAQGASQAAVDGRAEQVLREASALFPALAGGGAVMIVSDPGIRWYQPAHVNGYTVGRPAGVQFEGIVYHTTAGGSTLEALAAWFARATTGAATWFGVDPDGNIGQFVSLLNTAHAHGLTNGITAATAKLVWDNWYVGVPDPNVYLLGVELLDAGIPGNHTPAQLEAAAHLGAYLWERQIAPYAAATGAVVDRDHILGHYQIDNVDRPNCPSWPEERFTWMIERISFYLAGQPQPPVIVPPAPADRTGELLDALTVAARDWREAAGVFGQAQAAALLRADHLDGIIDSFR